MGTGFGMVLADAGGDVAMWAREPEVVEDINHRHVNSLYHEGIELPPTMGQPECERGSAGAEIVVLAIPSQTLRDNLSAWKEEINPDATLVSLMKGIELGTVMRMSEVIAEVTGFPGSQVAVVSGPNLPVKSFNASPPLRRSRVPTRVVPRSWPRPRRRRISGRTTPPTSSAPNSEVR